MGWWGALDQHRFMLWISESATRVGRDLRPPGLPYPSCPRQDLSCRQLWGHASAAKKAAEQIVLHHPKATLVAVSLVLRPQEKPWDEHSAAPSVGSSIRKRREARACIVQLPPRRKKKSPNFMLLEVRPATLTNPVGDTYLPPCALRKDENPVMSSKPPRPSLK